MSTVVVVERSAAIRPVARTKRPRRSPGTLALVGLGVGALLLAACGGDDDDDAASSSTTTEPSTATLAPVITDAPTTTAATTTTTTLPPLELVTEGATVIVANASGIDGAAGRMTDALATVGFSTADATNSAEDQLNTSKIYYDPDNADAKPVADSLREALGGGDIEVLELAVPAPLSDPDSLGDATVLLAMGNDTADKSLDELQGRVPPADDTADEATGDDTADATADESTDEESTDEGTGDDDTAEDTGDADG